MSDLVKTVKGLAIASVKTVNGLAIASVKTVKGLSNVSSGFVPTASTLGYYIFDSDYTDSSGNANNGTNSGGTIVAGGKIGGAVEFTANTQYVGIPNGVTDTGNEQTIVAWFYATSKTFERTILGDRDAGGNDEMRIRFDGTYVQVRAYWSGGYQFDITGTTSISLNTWYMVGVTRKVNEAKLFLNGAQEGSTDTGVATRPTSVARSPRIGHWFGTNSVYQFTGKVDQVIYENRGWTSTEMSDHYTLTNI